MNSTNEINAPTKKGSSFNRKWLEQPIDTTLATLKKIGWALGILGGLQFIFGLVCIILAIYSFSLKAPTDPHNVQISFYFFITCYLLIYVGIAILGLYLVPAFESMKKVEIAVAVTVYSSILLISSLALIVIGKWCVKLAKQSKETYENHYDHSQPCNIDTDEIHSHYDAVSQQSFAWQESNVLLGDEVLEADNTTSDSSLEPVANQSSQEARETPTPEASESLETDSESDSQN